jgi:hypothetical protein
MRRRCVAEVGSIDSAGGKPMRTVPRASRSLSAFSGLALSCSRLGRGHAFPQLRRFSKALTLPSTGTSTTSTASAATLPATSCKAPAAAAAFPLQPARQVKVGRFNDRLTPQAAVHLCVLPPEPGRWARRDFTGFRQRWQVSTTLPDNPCRCRFRLSREKLNRTEMLVPGNAPPSCPQQPVSA